jgi:hypothetical protein
VAVAFIAKSMTSHLSLDLWVHGTAPDQVLHYDFLYIKKRLKSSNQPFEHVLVLYDDFSGLLELIPATAAEHFVVSDALLQCLFKVCHVFNACE